MHFLVSPMTIWSPAVEEIEALGPLIVDQNPQHSLRKPLGCHTVPSITDQRPTDSLIPPVRVDVDRKDFPGFGSIRVPTRSCGCKTTNYLPIHRDGRRGSDRIHITEGVAICTIGWLECIEVIVTQKAPVCRLPGPYVN